MPVSHPSQTGAFAQALAVGIVGVSIHYITIKKFHALIAAAPIESWEYESAYGSINQESKRTLAYLTTMIERGRREEVEEVEEPKPMGQVLPV